MGVVRPGFLSIVTNSDRENIEYAMDLYGHTPKS
jgi:hypothetical protein